MKENPQKMTAQKAAQDIIFLFFYVGILYHHKQNNSRTENTSKFFSYVKERKKLKLPRRFFQVRICLRVCQEKCMG